MVIRDVSGGVEGSIPGAFDAAAQRYGDCAALIVGRRVLTYEASRGLVDGCAQAARQAGVRPGDRVLILGDYQPEDLASLIGAMKCGGIAVPVALSTPQHILERILCDAEPACIVGSAEALERVSAPRWAGVPRVDTGALPPPEDCLWPNLAPEAAALILYTSGSSGEAKGVVRTHATVHRSVRAAGDIRAMSPVDRIGMFSTFAVGRGVAAIFSAFLSGAALCPFDVRRLGFDRVVQWMRDTPITILSSSASLLRTLAAEVDDGVVLPDLRAVFVGGERVRLDDISSVRRSFGSGIEVLVTYAATETSTVTTHLVQADETFPGGVVPVGRALEGLTIRIVNAARQELPMGEEGEIAVEGRDLPLGYWRDEARTARVYGCSSHDPGARICYTGDLGRVRPDGRLEHVGRIDRRVKIRGFRVELDAVELGIAQHPAVLRVAVVVVGDESVPALVAYLQFRPSRAVSLEDVRGFAAERLPDYMVPGTFLVVGEIPLTASGKVDRPMLPRPPVGRPPMDTPYAAPVTSLERAVARVWSSVLGIGEIGRDDPFFMLGGDSLRAAQIARRLSERLAAEVEPWEVLETETIGALAAALAARGVPGP